MRILRKFKPLQKNCYVVLQEGVGSDPVAGVFTDRRAAYEYFSEIAEDYPGATVEIAEVPINEKVLGQGGNPTATFDAGNRSRQST